MIDIDKVMCEAKETAYPWSTLSDEGKQNTLIEIYADQLFDLIKALEQLNTKRICGDCQQVMNRNSDDDVWEPERGLRQLQKEILEHQCELLAKDTDILLLKQRVAELEGVIEYIEEYVPNIVATALSPKDGE